jgi:hypothetical protein
VIRVITVVRCSRLVGFIRVITVVRCSRLVGFIRVIITVVRCISTVFVLGGKPAAADSPPPTGLGLLLYNPNNAHYSNNSNNSNISNNSIS